MEKINLDAVLEDILAVKSLEQDIKAIKEAQDAVKARIKETMTAYKLEELTVDVFNAGRGQEGTQNGGLRGKYWFERMKADHKDEIREKSRGKLK